GDRQIQVYVAHPAARRLLGEQQFLEFALQQVIDVVHRTPPMRDLSHARLRRYAKVDQALAPFDDKPTSLNENSAAAARRPLGGFPACPVHPVQTLASCLRSTRSGR